MELPHAQFCPAMSGVTSSRHDIRPQGLAPELSKEEVERYSRHLVLPEVGMAGQRKLKATSILLVGAGGLGSPLALYLAAAGIGRLGLVDFDVVAHSNLQRQILHGTEDVGRSKLDSARDAIRRINPNVEVIGHETRLESDNAFAVLEPYDIVIDGTDNFATRYLVNDACVLLGKPNVYGSIFRFEGQASVFHFEGGPCYRCLYPAPPDPGLVPSCAEGGVLGVLPGIVGLIQATEALKITLGRGDTLSGRLLLFDALEMRFRELNIRRDPGCPVCGTHPTLTRLIDYRQFCGAEQETPAEAGPAVASGESEGDVSPVRLHQWRQSGEPVFLLDVREPHEYEICHLGGRLIPLRQLEGHLPDLPRTQRIVVYCRSGSRSALAARILRSAGFADVWNLRGGLLAWADDVDATMPKY
jgi:sulfur-carrier protein adenylyltransferase/sulfurtransferase